MSTPAAWTICVMVEDREVARAELRVGSRLTLGREEHCDLVVPEASVSRRHCAIEAFRDGLKVEDLGSANGIWVGHQRFQELRLKKGGEVRIGLALLTAEPLDEISETYTASTASVARDLERTRAALAPASEVYTKIAHERLATLIEVGKLLASSVDPEEVLATILDLLPQILPVQRAVIALRDESGELVAKLSWPRQDFEELSQIPSRQIIRAVMEAGEPRRIDDASLEDDLRAGKSIIISDIRAAICAPLKSSSRAIGAVYADYPGRAALYSREDLDFFGAFASLAGVAIETANMQRALRERERLDRNLQIAAEIQRGLLPTGIPEGLGLEIACRYKPSDQVGGDFYDLRPLAEGRLAVALGDVSGKSIGAALLMARLVSTLRAVIDLDPMPDATLLRVNDLLVESLDRPVFATASLLFFCPRTQVVSVASAGHLPLRLLKVGANEVATIHPKGLPLGIERGSQPNCLELAFATGSLAVLHTDGINEARNAAGEEFSLSRLDGLILRHRDEPLAFIADEILGAVQRWKGNARQRDDDIALVLVRAT